MVEMGGNNINLEFKINLFLNLYYHLERAAPSVKEHFSEKYRKKAIKLTDEAILENFMMLLGSSQRISWIFKKVIYESKDFSEIKQRIKTAVDGWTTEILNVLETAQCNYLEYFNKTAKPKLEKYKQRLEKTKPELEQAALRIPQLTKKPWKLDKFIIYLVESLSEQYGIGGEPIFDDSISIGIMKLKTAKLVIIHELTHINLGSSINRLVPQYLWRNGDSDAINEAFIQLITNSIFKYMDKPPRSKAKVPSYIRLFWTEWQDYISNLDKYPAIEDFLSPLLRRKLKSRSKCLKNR